MPLDLCERAMAGFRLVGVMAMVCWLAEIVAVASMPGGVTGPGARGRVPGRLSMEKRQMAELRTRSTRRKARAPIRRAELASCSGRQRGTGD